jgi:L-lactate dehydrogenase complex protein LldG
MSATNSAREEMLRRIRSALQDVPADEPSDAVEVTRAYRHNAPSEQQGMIERFQERVVDYKVTVRRVEEQGLPAAIAAACAARAVQRLVVTSDLPAPWLPTGIEILRDDDQALTNVNLDTSSGVLTGCALGIAQTGTIVLDGGVAQGRRILTLLPDYHLCVIYETQIVDLVPEAITRLAAAVKGEHRPITFISGPSATSDIELNRVEGVHGPRTLDVLIVREKK